MSKWNKPDKPLSEQFLQNEQRRRQMIVEASKRRREKQRKLQELNENLKKNEQQALQKHKKQKQQAYTKYLKNNNNMHDKYQQIKRNQKMQEQPKREVSKWKRKDTSETKVIQGLDLDKSHGKISNKQVDNKAKAKIEWVREELKQQSQIKKGLQNKKVVEKQFEKQWADQQIQQQMIGSKLIDSLDLDIDTLERGKQLSRKIEQIKHKNKQKPTIEQSEVQQIKNLIGYDSMLVSMDNCPQKPIVKQPISNKNIKPKPEVAQKKQVNEQETFNNLKHKKQAKILQWAHCDKIAEEADDLFSNCSSNKNSLANKQASNSNNNIKSSKKLLETIPEKRNSANKQTEKQKKNSSVEKPQLPNVLTDKKIQPVSKNNSIDKISNDSQGKKQSKQNAEVNRFAKVKEPQTDKNVRKIAQINQQNESNRNRSISKQKIKQNQAALQRQRQKSLQKLKQRKFSNQKPSSADKLRPTNQQDRPQVPKTQQPFRIGHKIPPIPSKPAYTVATHEQYFDVESFIKNDLLQLNQQERQLQEQIRNIHLKNKEKMKQIESKHEIKTNYKNSAQLINRHQNPYVNNDDNATGYAQQYQYNNNLNQDLIQQSLQKLDDLLIKRQIQSRQKTNQVSQQSHLKSQQKSIINPFSRPEDLHKQILQLAQNISKFQNQPVSQDVKGYGYQRKIKKKQQKSKQQIPQEISVSRNIDQQGVKRPSVKLNNPPVLSYSSKNNEVVDIDLQGAYYDPEDSLQTAKKQKVQVNEKLRGMLFDD